MRDFHKTIKGTISDGSRYHALNPELFYWAHATFVDQVIYTTDTFIRRLSREEKEQIFNEGKVWYSLYGVSDRGQPQTYDEFVAYWESMCERFVPHKTVLYGTGYIRKGIPGPRRIPKPVWRIYPRRSTPTPGWSSSERCRRRCARYVSWTGIRSGRNDSSGLQPQCER